MYRRVKSGQARRVRRARNSRKRSVRGEGGRRRRRGCGRGSGSGSGSGSWDVFEVRMMMVDIACHCIVDVLLDGYY